MIFRIVNGTEVHQLYIKGDPLATLNPNTHELEVKLTVEDSHAYDTVYLTLNVKDVRINEMKRELEVRL